MSDTPAAATVITVRRFRLHPAAPGRRGPTGWSYTYQVAGDPMVCQYGPGLASLRAVLKRRYPAATVTEQW